MTTDARWLLERSYDELQVGDKQRCPRERTITETDFVMWCSLTGDWFYMHVDTPAADASSFGKRVAPGMMIWAYGGGLGVPGHSRAIVANYGADKIRFTRPVFIGDTIRLELEVLAKADKDPGRGVIDLAWNLFNQNDEPVCISVLKILMGPASP